MHRVRQEDLPLNGNAHDFVGAEQGGVKLSAFLFDGPPGTGPKPHRHPYSFSSIGDTRLVSVDVHLSPTFVTEWAPHPRLTSEA